jgi:catechol 2,3-dioxygenase-like lactoylglutathione lyase family enzyme
MVDFLENTLGLAPEHSGEGQWVFSLPDGAKAEVFSSDSPHNAHFGTAPVAGFYVDDVRRAAEELRAAGIEIVNGPVVEDDGDAAWVHFRAPDGNLYELTQGSDLSPPAA